MHCFRYPSKKRNKVRDTRWYVSNSKLWRLLCMLTYRSVRLEGSDDLVGTTELVKQQVVGLGPFGLLVLGDVVLFEEFSKSGKILSIN